MYDDSGFEYQATKLSIADKSNLIGDYVDASASKRLIRDVPVKSCIEFPNVNSNARTVTLLEFTWKCDSCKQSRQQEYRNIPIQG